MKKYIGMVAVLAVAGLVQADITENYQIGGQLDNRDTGWASVTTVGSVATYSFASSEDTDLVFTISTVIANGDAWVLSSNFLAADSTHRQTDTHDGRLSDDEVITVSVSYVDPNSSLTSLKVNEIGAFWGNGGSETTVFTDASATAYELTAFDHNAPETLIDYSTTGLEALTKDNTGSWLMAVSAGNAGTTSGVGGFELEYTVIPEPATLGMVAVFGGGILFIRRKFMV